MAVNGGGEEEALLGDRAKNSGSSYLDYLMTFFHKGAAGTGTAFWAGFLWNFFSPSTANGWFSASTIWTMAGIGAYRENMTSLSPERQAEKEVQAYEAMRKELTDTTHGDDNLLTHLVNNEVITQLEATTLRQTIDTNNAETIKEIIGKIDNHYRSVFGKLYDAFAEIVYGIGLPSATLLVLLALGDHTGLKMDNFWEKFSDNSDVDDSWSWQNYASLAGNAIATPILGTVCAARGAYKAFVPDTDSKEKNIHAVAGQYERTGEAASSWTNWATCGLCG